MKGDKNLHGRDRLRQLRAFCQTARFKSMSKAADHLSLTQPAVSRQIRALEDELSTLLFERHGPKLFLTSAGNALQRLANPLVEAVDGLPVIFEGEVTGRVTGRIRISAGLTAARFLLPDYIKDFLTRYPDVQVQVETRGGRDSLRMIRNREVDFGIGAMEATPEDLEFRKVVAAAHVFIAPTDHPLANHDTVTVEDLKSCRWVLPVSGTYTRIMADSVARYFDTSYNVAVETAGWNVIKRFVEVGLGVSVVPSLCLSAGDRVATIPFEERIEAYLRPRVYGVIVRRSAHLSPAATRFIQIMDPGVSGAVGSEISR